MYSPIKLSLREQREFILKEYQAGERKPVKMIEKVQEKFASDPFKMGNTTIRKWMHKFRLGETNTADACRIGRPVITLDDRVGDEIAADCYAQMVDIATNLQIGWRKVRKYAVHRNWQSNNGMWVPREMDDELRDKRTEYCREMVENYSDLGFWNNVIFEGERIIYFNKGTGRNGTESTKKKFAEGNKSSIEGLKLEKTLFRIWWTTQGFVRFRFVPLEERFAGYSEELIGLYEAMQQKGLVGNSRKWFLCRNEGETSNSHCPDILAEFGWSPLLLPAKCPDISPTDYYIFMKFLTALNTYNSFTTVVEIEEFSARTFSKKKAKYFAAAVEMLPERWHRVIETEGEYIGTFDKVE